MRGRQDGGVYWLVVILLCVFGVLGMFSVGAPLLLLGLVLVAVSPWRSQRTVVWPAVAAVAAFVVAYVLVAPLGCTSTASSADAIGRTVCTNLVGIDYSGSGSYNPSLLPALAAAAVAAAVTAFSTRRVVRSGSGRPTPELGPDVPRS